MTVYVVAKINIQDRERYGRYESGFAEIFQQYDGELLAVDEAPIEIEGTWDATRTVLLRFPSKAALDAWYHSDAYQALAQHRFAASEANIAMIEALPVS